MNTLLLTPFQHLLNDPELIHNETLQPLWSGYGDISRFHSPKFNTSVIIKSVNPPNDVNHPRGWHSDVGHKRKLMSYKIEADFYQYYAQLCDEYCYVPRFIAYEADFAIGEEGQQALVMEDLQAVGFNDDNTELNLADVKVVVSWLAYFHACFMEVETNELWPIGTYWHLGTRQDEYNVMAGGALKKSAHIIDNTLNKARYKTLLHGDAKLANFCFGEFKRKTGETDLGNKPEMRCSTKKRVAAVDFQYVGNGVGVKDLAYFLGSCMCDKDLITLHDDLLTYYFSELKKGLAHYHSVSDCNAGREPTFYSKKDSYKVNAHKCYKDKDHHEADVYNKGIYKQIIFADLEKEWRKLYTFACADFNRFLQGWSPEHPKINTYLEAQTQRAIVSLALL